MSEDNGLSDHTSLFHGKNRPADEGFVIRQALSTFSAGARSEQNGIVLGPGDDAAVLDCGAPEFAVVSCDSMVEGVHFKREWLSLNGSVPQTVGRKAVICAASDIAAMGAVPKAVLVSAGLPPDTSHEEVKTLLDGVAEGSGCINAFVVGGNTTSSPVIFLDITVTGETVKRRFVRRAGARPGDAVFVTGEIGGAQEGLRIFENLLKNGGDTDHGDDRRMEKFHFPEARISVGLAVCRGSIATAMTDVSDGLLMDLGGIVSSSGVGAEVFVEKLPVSNSCGHDPRRALAAGGDYELVFTAPRSCARDIEKISEKTGVKITEIGGVTSGGSVRIFSNGTELPGSEFGPGGFMHNKK